MRASEPLRGKSGRRGRELKARWRLTGTQAIARSAWRLVFADLAQHGLDERVVHHPLDLDRSADEPLGGEEGLHLPQPAQGDGTVRVRPREAEPLEHCLVLELEPLAQQAQYLLAERLLPVQERSGVVAAG